MKSIKTRVMALVAAIAIVASAAVAGPAPRPADDQRAMEKIRKSLVMIPTYGVFDNLAYKVEGDTVTLYGQVVRPITRKEAERRVAKIEGVERVVNNIEVLPLSSFDDSIRARVYRSVFRTASLYRYALGANPSIHIIVNRGRVTLEGVVANRGDAQFAYVAANSVPGVFSVTNNLRVEGGR
jgi:hyperosmotically inducible protein